MQNYSCVTENLIQHLIVYTQHFMAIYEKNLTILVNLMKSLIHLINYIISSILM